MSYQGSYRFSVAPMMDWTDRHCRYFHRLLTRRALLYTEMVVAQAVIHGPRERLLGFSEVEHPIALQIGGSEPELLAEASKIGQDFGYDEININIGCPSDRVQSGRFGACLMAEPDLVAECFAAMQEAVSVPVTVKCRIGIDNQDPEETLYGFIEKVSAAGCDTYIVHARKAWLDGLSPKENRDIPPLDYELVRRLKRDHPDLTVVLNGGLADVDHALAEQQNLDGVMLGRAAYNTPAILGVVDARIFGEANAPLAFDSIIDELCAYADWMMQNDMSVHHLTRHILGLFHGQPGARQWRRTLSDRSAHPVVDARLIRQAYNEVRSRIAA